MMLTKIERKKAGMRTMLPASVKEAGSLYVVSTTPAYPTTLS